jgi:hypothetical protein
MLVPLCAGLLLAFGCGGKDPAEKTAAQAPGPSASAPLPADNEGTAVAKEILDLFDQAVAETGELMKTKPEPADLKPKLQALYDKYAASMAGLNPKFLALKAKDIRLFGAANGYLGENRGKHVYDKDIKLGEGIAYYNFQKGDQEIVAFTSSKLPALIDIAVKM